MKNLEPEEHREGDASFSSKTNSDVGSPILKVFIKSLLDFSFAFFSSDLIVFVVLLILFCFCLAFLFAFVTSSLDSPGIDAWGDVVWRDVVCWVLISALGVSASVSESSVCTSTVSSRSSFFSSLGFSAFFGETRFFSPLQ